MDTDPSDAQLWSRRAYARALQVGAEIRVRRQSQRMIELRRFAEAIQVKVGEGEAGEIDVRDTNRGTAISATTEIMGGLRVSARRGT